ncbi:MAG: hypothetical protein JSV09_09975 [Thermoplasmata archaeon]|nr:MAG: hypothetical protein JSV09_09975 [Thermoplasmata archaeon]
MTLIDSIMKWLVAPKTLQGIAGMTVIIIVLALDFAYWAGAIDVDSLDTGSGGEGEVEEVELPDDYLDTFSDTLERGSYRRPMVPDPRGEEEGVTYKLYPFPIEINRSEVTITSDGDPGSPPRGDGGDRNDIDLYIYRPGNDASGDLDSTSPDHQAATQYIAEVLNEDDLDPGNWTLRVDCYTGSNVQYDIEIVVTYTKGNETDEGE